MRRRASGASVRQAQATPAPGAVSPPDNTTASYGDWVLRCQQSVAARVCEIVQTLEQQGQRVESLEHRLAAASLWIRIGMSMSVVMLIVILGLLLRK